MLSYEQVFKLIDGLSPPCTLPAAFYMRKRGVKPFQADLYLLVLGPPEFCLCEFFAPGKSFLDTAFDIGVFYIYYAFRFVIERKNDPFF